MLFCCTCALLLLALQRQQLEQPRASSASLQLLGAGVRLRKAGQHKEAAEQFESAVRADPTNARAWYNLGLLAQVRDRAAALAHFQRSVLASPTYHFAHFGAATILAQAHGQQDAAAASYEQALALAPSFFQGAFVLFLR